MKKEAFHVDQLFDEWDRVEKLFVLVFPIPVELNLGDGRSFKLVDLFKIFMPYRILHSYPLFVIER